MESRDTEFEPKPLHDHFIEITRLAHPSGGEDPVRAYVAERAKRLGAEVSFYEPGAKEPGKRVIVLRRPGRGAFAEAPWVGLQAHMDMVTMPTKDIFPLKVFRDSKVGGGEGAWIGAQYGPDLKLASLGADDGIGVAAILTALGDDALRDYPLECLLTVQEETDMGGARDFAPELLLGRRYINLDSEELEEITYGSAGGARAEYRMCLRRSANETGRERVLVHIAGLRGGHSGVEINKGRANAVKLLAGALSRLNGRLNEITESGPVNAYDLLLVDIGQPAEDDKDNEIPRRASATVSLPKERVGAFIDDLKRLLCSIRETLQPVEGTMSFTVEPVAADDTPVIDQADTDAVLCMLGQIPHGTLRMMEASPRVVETSCNMAITRIDKCGLRIVCSNRSSNDAQLKGVLDEHVLIAERFGATVEVDPKEIYPPWEPDERSRLLHVAGCG